ncbi:hypothetical protein [Geodermatophilus marinus]|uniref:hypothetical protein n=1 Tax=Geodermatophilus sp. LHW52908 TaxID=2303986 RepID=UPI0018F6F57B|nr:hypothetical protein [Geodermatophilus sp. LHW52908]
MTGVLLALIVACEAGFWLLLGAGLVTRYVLGRRRAGAVLLAGARLRVEHAAVGRSAVRVPLRRRAAGPMTTPTAPDAVATPSPASTARRRHP